jgi:hypothetical protein
MKLHSDTLTENDIYAALRQAADMGDVPAHLIFDMLRPAGSRTRANAWDIHLGTYTKDRDTTGKMRRTPSNSTRQGDLADYTATYSEWGWFIARLYWMDSEMVFGPYKSLEHFDQATRYAFTI